MHDQVYVIGEPGSPIVKIGVSNDVQRRLREIQANSPIPLKVLWTSPGGLALERALHQHFADQRTHGEWFAFDADPATVVRNAVETGLVPVADPIQTATKTPKARKQAPPLDLVGNFYLTLRDAYGDGHRFTPVEVAERFGYMPSTVQSYLNDLMASGRVAQRLPTRTNWSRQEFSVRAFGIGAAG